MYRKLITFALNNTLFLIMKKFLLSLSLLAGLMTAQAQESKPKFTPSHGALLDGRTIVKTNLLGYTVGSYSISAERILTKRLSLQVGFSKLGEKSLGDMVGIKEISEKYLPEAKIASQSMSVDLRFYLSRRGYGHGFYLQPYFRHENHTFSGAKIETSRDLPAGMPKEYHPYTASHQIKSNSFGLSLGTQWLIGSKKNIVIDWTILGLHYSGSAKSQFTALSPVAVDSQKVEEFKSDISKLAEESNLSELKDLKFEVAQDGSSVKTEIKHPYLFLRSSLSIGFRF